MLCVETSILRIGVKCYHLTRLEVVFTTLHENCPHVARLSLPTRKYIP